MSTIEQNESVGRRKPGEPPRKPITLSLAQDVREFLEAEQERTGAPMSRTIDIAVRLLKKQTQGEPGSPES